MTIQEIYKLAIKRGIENDFRPKAQIEKQLKRIREKYEKLDKSEKEIFDVEKLTNPYSDSRIQFDSGNKNIKKSNGWSRYRYGGTNAGRGAGY